MKIDNQQAAFEAWALEYNSDLTEWPNVLFVKNGSGKYAIIRVQDAWEAWQAALESPEVQALRGALEMIAGMRPCPDSLMGNADIARAALAQGGSDA